MSIVVPHCLKDPAVLAPNCLPLNRDGGRTFTLYAPLPLTDSLLLAMGGGWGNSNRGQSIAV